MANLNHTGAFATVEPMKGDMTDWVGKVFKPLQDNLDKEKEKRSQAKKQLFEAYKNKAEFEIPDGLEIDSTQEIINSALPVLLEAHREASVKRDNAFRIGDLEGFLSADQEIRNLNMSGKTIRTALTSIEKDGLSLRKGFESGKLLLTKENIEKMGSFAFDQKKFMVDKGELFVAFQDVNQDGVIDEKDKQNLSKFINVKNLNFGKPAKVFDFDGKAKDIGIKLGKNVRQKFDSTGRKYSETELKNDLNQFSLNQEELFYLRTLDGDNPKSDEEYQEIYRDKIKSYADDKYEVFGGKGGGSGRGGSSKDNNYEKKILYVDEGFEEIEENSKNNPLGYSNPFKETREYSSFTWDGPYQLDDKISGLGISGTLTEIRLYENGEIKLIGHKNNKTTTESNYINNITGKPIKEVVEEIEDFEVTKPANIMSILGGNLGAKNIEHLKQILKQIKDENTD